MGRRKTATVEEVACAWGCVAEPTHLYRVPLSEVIEFGHLCDHHARVAARAGDPTWPLPSTVQPGPCDDPACPVLHADPANPIHPPPAARPSEEP